MRKLKPLLLAVSLLFMVLAAAPSATLATATVPAGSYADAWGDIILDSINVTFAGTDIISGGWYEANAVAGNLTDSDSADAYAEVDANTYWGWGLINETDLYSEAYVEGTNGLSYGDAGYFGSFEAESGGTLTVTFDYWLAYDVSTEIGDYAYAGTKAVLTIGGKSVSDLLSIDAFNGMAFDDETPLSTLSMEYDLLEGQTVNFSALVSSQAEVAPVPVPAAVWLLGSGLVGLLGIRKRTHG